MSKKYKFIVVEGPIGVGKTTLARKLANNLNSKIMLEQGMFRNHFVGR